MKKTLGIIMITLTLVIVTGCGQGESSNTNNSNTEDISKTEESVASNKETDKAAKSELYHEIGESFKMTAYYAGEPVRVTVNKIWMEDGSKHQNYINKNVSNPKENATVTFIDLTVKNIGKDPVTYGDILPYYAIGQMQVDLTYPKNSKYKDYEKSLHKELETGEEVNLVGVVPTLATEKQIGTFYWNLTQEIPEVVFQTPQSKRKDAIDVYDLNEDIHVLNHGDLGSYIVNIKSINKIDKVKGLQKQNENLTYLAIKMNVKNNLNEKNRIKIAAPTPMYNGKPATHTLDISIDGKMLKTPYEVFLDPKQKVNATLYLAVKKDQIEDVQLLYRYQTMITFPQYSMKINYNLD